MTAASPSLSGRLPLFVLALYRRLAPLRRVAAPLLPPAGCCRFQPTCSVYTYQAIVKYGTIKGMFLGLRRLLRCHP